jgi:hypothetical protein
VEVSIGPKLMQVACKPAAADRCIADVKGSSTRNASVSCCRSARCHRLHWSRCSYWLLKQRSLHDEPRFRINPQGIITVATIIANEPTTNRVCTVSSLTRLAANHAPAIGAARLVPHTVANSSENQIAYMLKTLSQTR